MRTIRTYYGSDYLEFINLNEPCAAGYCVYHGTAMDLGQLVVAWDLTKCRYPFWDYIYSSRSSSEVAGSVIFMDSPYNVAWVYTSNSTQTSSEISGADFTIDGYTNTTDLAQKIRNYFDSQPVPASGSATIDIPANGANLTFTSALLGTSVTKFISKNDVIDFLEFPDEADGFNIMWLVSSNNVRGIMLAKIVDSEISVICNTAPLASIGSNLIYQLYQSGTGYVYARTRVSEMHGGSSGGYGWQTVTGTSFVSGVGGLDRFVFAKAASAIYFETAMIWHDDKFQGTTVRAGRCIMKRDGTFVAGTNTSTVTGEFITASIDEDAYEEEITVAQFNGTIKVMKFNQPIVTVSGSSGYHLKSGDNTIYIIIAMPA